MPRNMEICLGIDLGTYSLCKTLNYRRIVPPNAFTPARDEAHECAAILPLATQVIAVNSGMKTIIFALPFELRMCFEKAIIVNVLLWGCKSWAIQSKKIQALRVF